MKLTFAQLDRACGVLLGAAVGDALGAGYEFGAAVVGNHPEMIGGGLGDFAPGEWTDDTAMTWAVADVAASGADLRTDEALDAIAARFRRWYDGRPPDIGINTLAVLTAAGPEPSGAAMTEAARARQEATGRTGSNGSLMRTSPVALAHLDDPAALVEAAYRVSALTHADPDALQACALWCLAIRHAVLTGAFDLRAGLSHLPEDAREPWAERVEAAETRDPRSFNPNGWVVSALQAAWGSIVQTPVPTEAPGGHLEAALETAIRIGHDTDTVASIAGALLGARWGASSVPTEWRQVLHGYPGIEAARLEELALLLVRKPGTHSR
jgi:ADP-ribosylglycohydrolase